MNIDAVATQQAARWQWRDYHTSPPQISLCVLAQASYLTLGNSITNLFSFRRRDVRYILQSEINSWNNFFLIHALAWLRRNIHLFIFPFEYFVNKSVNVLGQHYLLFIFAFGNISMKSFHFVLCSWQNFGHKASVFVFRFDFRKTIWGCVFQSFSGVPLLTHQFTSLCLSRHYPEHIWAVPLEIYDLVKIFDLYLLAQKLSFLL